MAKEVLMPKLGMTMETGTIIKWYRQEGDSVEEGDVLLEVMTDKINIEVEAYETGKLLKVYYDEEEEVPVNQVIAFIGEAGEQVPEDPPEKSHPEESDQKTGATKRLESTEEVKVTIPKEKPRATPAARKLARELDISLYDVKGHGPRGRIHREDVQAHADQSRLSVDPVPPKEPMAIEEKRTTITGMRKVIGERMVQSVQEAPHVTLHSEVDMTEAVQLRTELLPVIEEKTGLRVSYTEIILKAVAASLRDHPMINASIQGNDIVLHQEVNIGLAVSHSNGLLVPVIKQVDQLGLAALTKQSKQIAREAREGRLAPDALQGGTFTVSNLGMYAVDAFTPIINLPQTAILGIGRIQKKPTEFAGELTLRSLMSISLSFDHRVVDGAPAAAFLTQLKVYLENPYQLLV